MQRDFILFITDDLRPYIQVLDSGLEALKREMSSPFFQWPATPIGHKPNFARIILSEKTQSLLQDLLSPKYTEQQILHAALVIAKKERRDAKEAYRSL